MGRLLATFSRIKTVDARVTLPAVTGSDPSALPRVCPECGKDPRAGSPRTPWWCRRSGLPLWLVPLLATLIAYRSSKFNVAWSVLAGTTGTTTFAAEAASQERPVTIGELRAAGEQGPSAVNSLIERLYRADRHGVHPGAYLVADVGPDQGYRGTGIRLGWSLAWCGAGRTHDPPAPPSLSRMELPTGWMWDGRGASLFGHWSDGSSGSRDAWFDFPNLGALIGLSAAAVVLALRALLLLAHRTVPGVLGQRGSEVETISCLHHWASFGWSRFELGIAQIDRVWLGGLGFILCP